MNVLSRKEEGGRRDMNKGGEREGEKKCKKEEWCTVLCCSKKNM